MALSFKGYQQAAILETSFSVVDLEPLCSNKAPTVCHINLEGRVLQCRPRPGHSRLHMQHKVERSNAILEQPLRRCTSSRKLSLNLFLQLEEGKKACVLCVHLCCFCICTVPSPLPALASLPQVLLLDKDRKRQAWEWRHCSSVPSWTIFLRRKRSLLGLEGQ